ncbi:MAG: hypothetical protein LC768_02335 [Acidobacteria bacterium]|nr:hypothetical protein [Acidobacteriota bacterium]
MLKLAFVLFLVASAAFYLAGFYNLNQKLSTFRSAQFFSFWESLIFAAANQKLIDNAIHLV